MVLAGLVAGCSPSGTGTIQVKDRNAIRTNLEKGAKPVSDPKKVDENGIRYRNKKGGD